MFVKFEVFNNQDKLVGNSTISMDWKSHVWLVSEDKTSAWKRVTTARSGKFEFKDWGVVWMWDKGRNIAIMWDAPKTAFDLHSLKGSARLYDPVDSDCKDAIAKWTIDPGAAGKAAMVMHNPLPFSRQAYVDRINMLLPAPYATLNNDLLTNKLRKDDPAVLSSPGKYTSCGSMPGFVSQQVALSKGLKGQSYIDWVKKNSLNGTNRVRDLGNSLGCWVESAPNVLPKPGDVYALLDHGATDKKNSGISHVGVVELAQANSWTTMDLGQSGGFDGAKNTREYKSATCELWGETNQGGGFRTVAGWVDLEKYFKM